MRLVLIGQAAFAEQVLSRLVEAGHDIALVCAPPAKDGRPDPLAAAAVGLGLPLRTPSTYKDPALAEEIHALGADLGLLAYVTTIIPRAVIEAPRLGTICFHPSLLPRFRGGSALAWQIIRGETRGGLTVFWTDPGIDTGPILLQREIEIGPDDTAGSLYFEKIFQPGVEAMIEAVGLIEAGEAPRIPQDERLATYDPLCTDEHAAIDWERPVGEVYGLIRGCDPQPGAHATWRGEPVRLYDARRLQEADAAASSATPGRVLSLGEGGLVAAAGRGPEAGAIRVGRLRGPGAKARAHEVATSLGLEPGAALGPGRRSV